MTRTKVFKLVLITLLMLLLAACNSASDQPPANPQNGPGQGRPEQGTGPGSMMSIISEATGLDMQTIREQSTNGATLAEIITENGGDVEAARAQLIEAMKDQPDATEQDIEQIVDSLLNNPLPQRGMGGGRPGSSDTN